MWKSHITAQLDVVIWHNASSPPHKYHTWLLWLPPGHDSCSAGCPTQPDALLHLCTSSGTASALWPTDHSMLKLIHKAENMVLSLFCYNAHEETLVLTGMATSLFKKENGVGGSSPSCGCKILKLTVRPSILGGVPITQSGTWIIKRCCSS